MSGFQIVKCMTRRPAPAHARRLTEASPREIDLRAAEQNAARFRTRRQGRRAVGVARHDDFDDVRAPERRAGAMRCARRRGGASRAGDWAISGLKVMSLARWAALGSGSDFARSPRCGRSLVPLSPVPRQPHRVPGRPGLPRPRPAVRRGLADRWWANGPIPPGDAIILAAQRSQLGCVATESDRR